MKNSFVGFGNSDKFIDAIDRERPINLSISCRRGKPDRRYGMAIDATVLTMSQAQENETVYFETAVHKYRTLNGEYFGTDKEKVSRVARQVQEAVEKYLGEFGVTWRDAMLSMPLSYVKLEGDPTFLKWDNEGETFHYLSGDERSRK